METKKQAIKAYSRVIMDADISGSPLDLRLASALKSLVLLIIVYRLRGITVLKE